MPAPMSAIALPVRALSVALLSLVAVGAPTAARAAPPPAMPYANIGLGYGKLNGNNLIVTETAGDLPVASSDPTCCPEGGLAFDVRLGVKLFGAFGVEGGVLGNAWSIGGDAGGGAGFAGGGLRLWTLGLVELLTDPLEFPVDLSFGAMFGYAIVGKDFAYQGSFSALDATLEWKVADIFVLGARLNLVVPSYQDFAYTDFGENRGRCLDSGGRQVITGGVVNRDTASCSGSGPDASLFSPQLVATFLMDIF